jgi:hypothetical protein
MFARLIGQYWDSEGQNVRDTYLEPLWCLGAQDGSESPCRGPG